MNTLSTPLDLKKIWYRLNHWETWPWLIKYYPMIPFWIVYCIKAKSFWFFTASNPTLTFGGYEGEPKVEMYNLLPVGLYPKTKLIEEYVSEDDLEAVIAAKKFSFPVAVKPDVGRMGLMFRKISSMKELIAYHHRIKVNYLIQEFIHYPIEVSVFYYRLPSQTKGTITGFVRKEQLSVTGDGSSTLLRLMQNCDRVKFRLAEMKTKHASNLHEVILPGERYVLSEALNLSRGGKLISLEHMKDDHLLTVFDNISRKANFYFGRFDVKCSTIDDLKKGINFSILEFNGSGAEPHHVYGNGNSLPQAIRILLEHWNILYRVSVENHKRGVPYWTFKQGLKHLSKARKHFKHLHALDFQLSKVNAPEEGRECTMAGILNEYELTN
jgi:hypothetical protein